MGELSFEVMRTRVIRSSQIAQHYFHAAKPDYAEEVLSMKFVAHNQPAEPAQPGEQPLHHPAAQVAAQRSAVLSLAPVLTVGRDHFDSVFLIKMSVERVRVTYSSFFHSPVSGSLILNSPSSIFPSQLVPRYRRSSREVEQSVLGVYLSGSNTRRIRGALEPLLTGAALSKSAVSRLVLRLEESYRTWQGRDLAEDKDRVFVPGCDLSEGAQWRESGFATRSGGAGGSRERRESAAEPDDHGSGIRRRLAVVAGRSDGAEDGPSPAGDQRRGRGVGGGAGSAVARAAAAAL